MNLLCQTIIDSPLCDWCKLEPESSLHALWLCPKLDVVWDVDDLWACRRSTTFLNFKDLLSWLIIGQLPLDVFSVTMWSIWNQRNQVCLH